MEHRAIQEIVDRRHGNSLLHGDGAAIMGVILLPELTRGDLRLTRVMSQARSRLYHDGSHWMALQCALSLQSVEGVGLLGVKGASTHRPTRPRLPARTSW